MSCVVLGKMLFCHVFAGRAHEWIEANLHEVCTALGHDNRIEAKAFAVKDSVESCAFVFLRGGLATPTYADKGGEEPLVGCQPRLHLKQHFRFTII